MTRTARPAREVATGTDLLSITAPVRRLVEARAAASGGAVSEADVEDIVQETLVRVWAARWRLERRTLPAYGLVVARNLVASAQRREQLRHRHAARLVDPGTGADPLAGVLLDEERAALARALAAMRENDRRLLVEHEVHGVGIRTIAADDGIAANTVAARLARARARLRVEHLLALRRVSPPTPRCRGVLDALSLGDRRRQVALGVPDHLLDCPTCAALAEPLVSRRRSLTAFLPLWLVPAPLVRWVRANPWPAAAAGVTAAVVTVVLIVATGSPPPAAPPSAAPSAPPATLSVAGARLLPADRVPSLAADVGRTAVARDVPVQSVVADEGFWAGDGPGRRVWVQLESRGESAVRVRAGRLASFTGRLVAVTPGTAGTLGITTAEGAAELRSTGAYVLIPAAGLTLR